MYGKPIRGLLPIFSPTSYRMPPELLNIDSKGITLKPISNHSKPPVRTKLMGHVVTPKSRLKNNKRHIVQVWAHDLEVIVILHWSKAQSLHRCFAK